MIDAVGSIPPFPPSTTAIIDKDRLVKERWVGTITAGQGHRRIQPTAALLTKTANAAVNDNYWRHRLHPTAASIDADPRRRRLPLPL